MPKLYLDRQKASEAGKKGKKTGPKRKTIIKNSLSIKTIEELKDDVLKVWKELIESGNEENKKFAAKEISKYVFATKKESTIDLTAKGNINIFTVKPDTDDE